MKSSILQNVTQMLYLFIFVLFATSLSQAESISIKGKWKKGDQIKVQVVKCKIRATGPDTTMRNCATIDYSCTVLEAGSTYLMKWACDSIYIDKNSLPPGDPSVVLLDIAKNLNAVYRTDSDGAFESLVNWVDIKTQIDNIRDHLADGIDDPSAKQRFIDFMSSLSSSRKTIEALFIKELQMFHNVYGTEQDVGDLYGGVVELPAPIGNLILPYNVESLVEKTPEDDYVVTMVSEIEKEQANESFNQLMDMIITSLKLEDNEGFTFESVNLLDQSTHYISSSTTWPDSIYFIREIKMGPNVQSDVMIFNKIED